MSRSLGRKALAIIGRVAPFLLPWRERAILRLATLPRTWICDVQEGSLVKVVGHVRLPAVALTAPFSGRPCAYYRAKVEVPARRGSNINFPGDLAEGFRDFLVEDGSGQATVTMGHHLVEYPDDWQDRFSDAVIRFLEARGHGQVVQRLTPPSPLAPLRELVRYSEAILAEGTPVCVVGRARWAASVDQAATAAYRGARRHVVLEADGRAPLIVSGEIADWIEDLPRG